MPRIIHGASQRNKFKLSPLHGERLSCTAGILPASFSILFSHILKCRRDACGTGMQARRLRYETTQNGFFKEQATRRQATRKIQSQNCQENVQHSTLNVQPGTSSPWQVAP